MRRNSIRSDSRAVEGMPIRLVVAVTVGAAAMSLLVPMLDTVEETQQTAVTVEPEHHQVVLDSETTMQDVTVAVVSAEGEPIPESTVIVSERSLPLVDGPQTFETGPDSHEVTLSIGDAPEADVPVSFRRTQQRGTIELGVRPPSNGEFTVRSDHPEITVSKPG
ncbi:MAG: hypothetical protein V5A32_00040 [Halovenus sp.]